MDSLQLVVLALVQGITEFLPISSSAHLILIPALTGWPDQGLGFDVAVHIGTLLAVIGYFRAEIGAMLVAWSGSPAGRRSPEARLARAVILATVPVVLAGLLFKEFIESQLRSVLVIAVATIGFGLLLGWADWRGTRQRDEYTLGWRGALLIGLAQMLALVPGTSRSGITLTAGLLLGLTGPAAARFSFLLSIPTIAGSGVLLGRDLLAQPVTAPWGALALAALLAGLSAYACIHWLLRLLERSGLWPFVLYRLLLGGLLLWLL